MSDIFQKIHQAATAGPASVMCIVIATTGSAPRKAGAKMLVGATGLLAGTIGGGATEYEVIQKAMKMEPGTIPEVHTFHLNPEQGTACGGSITVYMELVMPADRLLIFGAGHIGKALAGMALRFGFRVTLVDDREGMFTSHDQQLFTCIQGSYPATPESLHINKSDYVVVATYEHRLDIEIAAMASKASPVYLGMIGSKAKLAIARQRFSEEFGLTDHQIGFIDMPIGVAIATDTPDEIALAIMASIIDARNQNRGLKPKK